MTTYTVTAQRGKKYWVLQCVEFPGAISEVSRLDKAFQEMKEPVAFVAAVPEDEVEIRLQVQVPAAARQHLEQAHSLRQESTRANRLAAREIRQAAVGMKDEGLSLRDIAVVMGVGYQRVHQYVTEQEIAVDETDTDPQESSSGHRVETFA